MERKLASLRRISELKPIEGADLIELAIVDGWKVVVAKSVGHKVGDMVIYCEIDSFLPIREEFEFLRKGSYKKMADGSEGFRLKTIKLRGQVSQGLILPLSVLEGEEEDQKLGHLQTPEGPVYQLGPYDGALVIEEGADVTHMLGIVKYDPPMPACLAGIAKGPFPSFVSKTDEERVQNLASVYEDLKKKTYYVTEKLDGGSTTYYFKDGEFGVCSRNLDLEETPDNTMWKFARAASIEEKLRDLARNIAIQGEIIGEGIQGNPYKMKGQTVRFYSVFDIDAHEYMGFIDFKSIIDDFGLKTVPVLNMGFELPETIDELLKLAEDKSDLNPEREREGIVVRSLGSEVSFKAISNKFLLGHEQ
jgi:tRNA-binding EMAP/Myf-like protein